MNKKTAKKAAKKAAKKVNAPVPADIQPINAIVQQLDVLETNLTCSVSLIKIHPLNESAERLEGIETLATSIANVGLLQLPICRPYADGYQLLAGRRRFVACTEYLKWTEIPIRVVVANDAQAVAVIAAENENRMQVNIWDQCVLMKTMCEDLKMDYVEAGARLGMNERQARMLAKVAMLPKTEFAKVMKHEHLSFRAVLLYARQSPEVRKQCDNWWAFRSVQDMTRTLEGLNPVLKTFKFPLDVEYAGKRSCESCSERTDRACLFKEEGAEVRCLNPACANKKTQCWKEKQVEDNKVEVFLSEEYKPSDRKIGTQTLKPMNPERVKIVPPTTKGAVKVMVGETMSVGGKGYVEGEILTVVPQKGAEKKSTGKVKTEPPATAAGAKALWEQKMTDIWGLRWIRILSAIYNSMPRETLDRSAEDGHLIRTMRPGELNAEHWSKEWQTLGLPERVMKRLTDIPLATVLRLTLQFGQRGHAWQGARYGLDLAGKSVEDLQMYALHQLDEGMHVALRAQNGKQGSCKDRRGLAVWLCEIFDLPLVEMKVAASLDKPAGKSIAKLAVQAKIPMEKCSGMQFSM